MAVIPKVERSAWRRKQYFEIPGYVRDREGEKSNIIRFQNLFEITKVHYAFPQAEQRVFLDVKKDKQQYPEDTGLRKKLKKYLIEGKNPGIGVGIIEKIYKLI